MKYLKLINALFDGKKRSIGGIAYVLIDLLISLGKIDAGTGNQLKIAAAGLFIGGVGHAISKRGK